jgi:hypothetical protein
MNAKHFIALIACTLVCACTSSPLAPTAEATRVAQIAIGQSQADVEKIMQRAGRIVTYALKPDETTQIWRYEDHFNSRCLFVTYDTAKRVKDVAMIERERDERGKFGAFFSGSC